MSLEGYPQKKNIKALASDFPYSKKSLTHMVDKYG
jgi:hypothetical protein